MFSRSSRRNGLRLVLLACLAGIYVLAWGIMPGADAITGGRAAAATKIPGVTEDTILIGTFQALSGPAAPIGVGVKKGLESYLNYVNEQGGVHGRKIKLIVEDDGFQPSRTVAAVKKMVEQDEIFAIVGGLGTPTGLAVMDYVLEKQVPFVYQGSGASVWADPPKKYYFPVQPNYTNEGALLAQYAVKELKARKIAVIYQNDDIGKEGLAGMTRQLKKLGRAVDLAVGFAPSEMDFSSYVLKLQAANPDVVILYCLAKPAAAVVRESQKMGFAPQFLTTYPNADLAMFNLAGPAWNGVIIPGWVPILDEKNPDARKFLGIFNKYYPKELPSGYVAAGFIAGEIFVEGLKRAGKDLTRDKLIAALETLNGWDGIMAKDITYGPNERSGKTSMYFLKGENNNYLTISGWIKLGK